MLEPSALEPTADTGMHEHADNQPAPSVSLTHPHTHALSLSLCPTHQQLQLQASRPTEGTLPAGQEGLPRSHRAVAGQDGPSFVSTEVAATTGEVGRVDQDMTSKRILGLWNRVILMAKGSVLF